MNWHLVSLESVAPQRWRNGGGFTRELLAWPAAADWRIRMSVADVEAAGPFSRFEGVERWFAVLEGAGVELRVDGKTHRIDRASGPFRFDGGADVDCALVAGATRDFNLMAAPGTATMTKVRGSLAVRTSAPALLAVYAHSAPALLLFDGRELQVPAMHLAWSEAGPVTGTVSAQDALWMETRT